MYPSIPSACLEIDVAGSAKLIVTTEYFPNWEQAARSPLKRSSTRAGANVSKLLMMQHVWILSPSPLSRTQSILKKYRDDARRPATRARAADETRRANQACSHNTDVTCPIALAAATMPSCSWSQLAASKSAWWQERTTAGIICPCL